MCGRAPTGSGKTIAFGIPLIARIDRARKRQPTALILAPTRELTAQICRELEPLAATRGLQRVLGLRRCRLRRASAVSSTAVSTSSSRAPAAWPTCSARTRSTSSRSRSWWSTKPTAWPTWASCPRCGACSTRRRRAARRCCSRRRSTARSRCSPATTSSDAVRHDAGAPEPDGRGAHHVFWRVDGPAARRRHRRARAGGRPDDRVLPHAARRRPPRRRSSRRPACAPRRSTAAARRTSAIEALADVQGRPGRGARRHRRRRPRHPRRRRRVRRALRHARRRQGLPAPFGPHRPRRRGRPGRLARRSRRHPHRVPHAAGPRDPGADDARPTSRRSRIRTDRPKVRVAPNKPLAVVGSDDARAARAASAATPGVATGTGTMGTGHQPRCGAVVARIGAGPRAGAPASHRRAIP